MLIRPDGSGQRMLTEGKASSGFASWSPDGKRLIYRVMGEGQQGLRILTLDDGKVATLTNEYDTFPMWSPRGDRIAFCSFRDGDYEIYTMRLDGSECAEADEQPRQRCPSHLVAGRKLDRVQQFAQGLQG